MSDLQSSRINEEGLPNCSGNATPIVAVTKPEQMQSGATLCNDDGSEHSAKSRRSSPRSRLSSPFDDKKTWYDVMYPTYKTRSKEFRHLFGEMNSKLIVDFSCAHSKDILRQGRLYISTKFCCFYSNIFGYESTIKIDWKDITKITKEKTAFLIPNAIQINTTEKQYFFATFNTRDATYDIMYRVWRGVLDEQPMSNEEVCQVIICQYPEEEAGEGSDIVIQPDQDAHSNADLSKEQLTGEISDEVKARTTSWRESTPGEFVFDKTIRKPLSQIYDLLFTNSNFYFNFQKDRGSTELDVSDWEQNESGISLREVSYNMKMNNPVGPKTCQVKEHQVLQKDCIADQIYCIDTEAFNSGVPYADAFTVKTHICAYKDSASSCRITVKAEIVFRKELWNYLKGKIETSAWAGIRNYYNDLGIALKSYREDQMELAKSMHHRLDCLRDDTLSVQIPAISNHQSPRQTTISSNLLIHVSVTVLSLTLVLNILVVWNLYSFKEEDPSPSLYSHSTPIVAEELLVNLPQTDQDWVYLLRSQAAQHGHLAKEIVGSLQKVSSNLIESEKVLEKVRRLLLEQSQSSGSINNLLRKFNDDKQHQHDTKKEL